MVSEDIFLFGFGLFESLLAVWLILGIKAEYPALITVVLMIAIIACNLEHFHVLFRNVAIATSGIALYLITDNKLRVNVDGRKSL